jgi:hypothetical protein
MRVLSLIHNACMVQLELTSQQRQHLMSWILNETSNMLNKRWLEQRRPSFYQMNIPQRHIYMYTYIYVYIYTYIHTHTYTHTVSHLTWNSPRQHAAVAAAGNEVVTTRSSRCMLVGGFRDTWGILNIRNCYFFRHMGLYQIIKWELQFPGI